MHWFGQHLHLRLVDRHGFTPFSAKDYRWGAEALLRRNSLVGTSEKRRSLAKNARPYLKAFKSQIGCSKCRHSPQGCGACNPERFDTQKFAQWLVDSHGFTAGSARDYRWGAEPLLRRNSLVGTSDKRRNLANLARPYLKNFKKHLQHLPHLSSASGRLGRRVPVASKDMSRKSGKVRQQMPFFVCLEHDVASSAGGGEA